MQLITNKLIAYLLENFKVEWNGIHGLNHWMRVHDNGLWLAAQDKNINTRVIALFGILHDACRWDDEEDKEHGSRASKLVEELNGKYFDLDVKETELLTYACLMHPYPLVSFEPTVGACWDADRLELSRVGIEIEVKYLSTKIAKDYVTK